MIEGSVHHLDFLADMVGARCETIYAHTWNPAWGECCMFHQHLMRHDQIVRLILIVNILLVALATVAAMGLAVIAVIGALAAVALLLVVLAKADPGV